MDTDDDDILPPALTECSSPVKLFRNDDITWVKYRKYYWPAVIKSICKKKKRLSILFVDSPKYGMSIPFSRAIAFNSAQGKALQKQNIEPAELALLFEKTLKNVEDYLCKRVLQEHRLSPTQFFQQPTITLTNHVVRDLFETHENENEVPQSQSDEEDLLTTESPFEGSQSQSDDEDLLTEGSQSQSSNSAEPEINRDELEDPETRIKPLLKLIHSKPCRNHLLKILNGTKQCDRHKRFRSVTPSVRRQLKMEAGYDPIYSSKDFADEVTELMELLKLSASPQFDVRSYLFDVWIPEATIWALAKHHKISLIKANELFARSFTTKHL